MHVKMGSGRRSEQGATGFKGTNSGGSRFAPCPVCGRNVAIALVHEHLNRCLTPSEMEATTAAGSLPENLGAESSQGTFEEGDVRKRERTKVDSRHNSASQSNVEPSSKKQKVVLSPLEGGQLHSPDREMGEASRGSGGGAFVSHRQRTEDGAIVSIGEQLGVTEGILLEAPAETGEGSHSLAKEGTKLLNPDFKGNVDSSSDTRSKHQNNDLEADLRQPEAPDSAESTDAAGHSQESSLLKVSQRLPVESGRGSIFEHRDMLISIESTRIPEDNERRVDKGTPKSIAPIFKKPNKVRASHQFVIT